jgi:penicillin-binding protein 1A
VAQLPGGWNGRIYTDIEEILGREIGGSPMPVSAEGDLSIPDMAGQTGSIDRPVPPGDVGHVEQRRVGSILDVIFGN